MGLYGAEEDTLPHLDDHLALRATAFDLTLSWGTNA